MLYVYIHIFSFHQHKLQSVALVAHFSIILHFNSHKQHMFRPGNNNVFSPGLMTQNIHKFHTINVFSTKQQLAGWTPHASFCLTFRGQKLTVLCPAIIDHSNVIPPFFKA